MEKIDRLREGICIDGANKSMKSINSLWIGVLFLSLLFVGGNSTLRAQDKGSQGRVIASFQDTLMFDTANTTTLPVVEKHTIIGSIFSMEWKEYLPGAIVELTENKKIFVISDREGNFEIKIPEKYWKDGKVQLEVRFIGCQTKTLNVREDDKLPVKITLLPQLLDDKSVIPNKTSYDPIYKR